MRETVGTLTIGTNARGGPHHPVNMKDGTVVEGSTPERIDLVTTMRPMVRTVNVNTVRVDTTIEQIEATVAVIGGMIVAMTTTPAVVMTAAVSVRMTIGITSVMTTVGATIDLKGIITE